MKLADALGIDKIKKYAKLLNVEFENDDLSVGLGNLSGGITISSLLSCYTPFINNGKYYEPDSVEKIIDPKGKVVYSSRVDERQVFSDSTAFIINDMLKETVKKGTAKKLSSFPFAICAKTGTNGTKQGNVDAYCVAYTTEHIIAVRLGNADGKKWTTRFRAEIIRRLWLKIFSKIFIKLTVRMILSYQIPFVKFLSQKTSMKKITRSP